MLRHTASAGSRPSGQQHISDDTVQPEATNASSLLVPGASSGMLTCRLALICLQTQSRCCGVLS